MTTLLCFCLSVALHTPKMATRPSTPPTMMHLDLGGDNPATLRQLGSFLYDKEWGDYMHEWSSWAKFDKWCQDKGLAYSIELITSTVVSENSLWTEKRHYVCSHGHSGGTSKYQKKHPKCQHKNESKKTNCHCKIIIKSYPHTSTILGCYQDEHNHKVGLANITYMQMLQSARQQIRGMLECKIDPREIICSWSYF
jgi:hypothetical protein